jgi:hypothetical protein
MLVVNSPIKREFHQINISDEVRMTLQLLQKPELVFNNSMEPQQSRQINTSVVKRKKNQVHLVLLDTVI